MLKRLMLPAAMLLIALIGIFTFGIQSTPPPRWSGFNDKPAIQSTPQGPTPTPAPLRPTDLKINPDFPTSNALIWEGVDGAGGYEVQAKSRTSDHAPWQAFQWESVGTPARSSFSHNELAARTTYLYRVRALDRNGNQIGEWSFTEERTIPTPEPTRTPKAAP